MAEEDLVVVSDRVSESLDCLLVYEGWDGPGGFKDVCDELFSLDDNIGRLQYLGRARGADHKEDHLVKVKDALLDIEDLINEMLNVLWRRRRSAAKKALMSFFSLSSSSSSSSSTSRPLFVRNRLFDRVKKASKDLDKMVKELPYSPTSDVTTFRAGRQENVIGRDNEKNEIIEQIKTEVVEEKENVVKFILISGVQGIGKTALARLVYNDSFIEQNFVRVWVFVGHRSSVRKIVLRFLEGAGRAPANRRVKVDELLEEVRRVTDGRRFFIVLDDVVQDDNRGHWLNSLKNLLNGCAKDSCVLLTTRSDEDEEGLKMPSFVQKRHRLNCLSNEESWDLFKKQAFMGRSSSSNQELEKIGREIAAKCDGVPLFLREISRILRVAELGEFKKWNDVEKINKILREKGYKSKKIAAAAAAAKTRNVEGDSSSVPEKVVVGRDQDKNEILKQLLAAENQEENPLIVSIVGMGGLGKTTLAQLIFKDEKVKHHFDLKIWVCVTDVFDVKAIMEKIILSITNNYLENLELSQLVILLGNELLKKRYLLILDDVLNKDRGKWLNFMEALPVGANGSAIVLTTGSYEVAMMTSENHLYDLSPLEEDDAWSLFKKEAFSGGQHPTNPEVEKIGREILKDKGLRTPMAIMTIGRILFSRDSETEWKSFYDNEFSTILEDGGFLDLATFRLSYDNLPSPLKNCFAYCALFPRNYEFDVKTLINLWISQGFISPEETGYDYFMELLERFFFHEYKEDEFGNVKCKMQSSMHDLACQVAGNVYANFPLHKDKVDRVLRHVSFNYHLDSSWQIPIPLDKLNKIRSLVLHRQFRWAIEGRSSSESICDVIMKLKQLRMLDLHNSGIKVLPKSVGELKHLRYLDLSQNLNLKVLPDSICELRNLQTLKLNHCSNLKSLPRGITMLSTLKNLENESCYRLTMMPQGLHQLSELQTLSEFVLSKGTVKRSLSKRNGKLDELNHLNYLGGKLKIKNLTSPEDDKTGEANLEGKEDLLSLILIWDIKASINKDDYEKALKHLKPPPQLKELTISAYGGIEFPKWDLPNLVKLSLSKLKSCYCLPPLDDLPNLQVLIVDELMNLKYILDETSQKASVSSLKELRLTNLPILEGWWKHGAKHVEEEATSFTCLSKLVIEDCPSLTSMPLFPWLEELLVLKNTSWEPFKRTVALSSSSSTTTTTTTSVPTKRSNRASGGFKLGPRTTRNRKSIRPGKPSVSKPTSTTPSNPLANLRTLHIMDMSNGDPEMWKSLSNLHSVTLDHVADINVHLKELGQVSSLQQLHIWRCDSLEVVPTWISESKSLKTISIKLCPKLRIPREGISTITSFKRVVIEDCPQVYHLETMLKDPLYFK